ncbi:uncharacterized protein LOC131285475 [Anopheles ziemanni]|uniref:uncharacterized protein LOC131266694 n=1 Tax=Anopheles coustani TaxID=139045 RepID=UPI00265A4D1D|nr:uncharacterized protein LOC131266694 [Anopheles coustani]XP_058170316.1 uncharacterized protein LOC131285475 [Anopheles ziemanni]
MAKGAKRKTKWVSLSLANTTTSVATGSDSEQHPHPHHQVYGDGHRQKTLNGSDTTTTKHSSSSKESASGLDSSEENNTHELLDTQSGHRTDTSASGSECPTNGTTPSDRRTGGAYHRRRPPPYHTRSSWTAGGTGTVATNGRGSYNGGNRTGYYNGGGYYGRRSYYDSHSRRPASKTTSGEGGGEGAGGGGGGGTTVNDDEYTRITTPRQDVLFKKGYLSRPKPTTTATASTSNENTASSSIAGTTSEGSDGGNGGGSNSISTTESITSEYGGSFAADGSPLFDYPYPFLPCGYFTENGVLVMNGFAVDNNGYSYFNGGQTYIYPPNFNNCQQQPPSTVEPTDSMPYPANDETNTNNPEDQSTPTMAEVVVPEGGITPTDDSCRVDVGAGGDGGGNPSFPPTTTSVDHCEPVEHASDLPACSELQEEAPIDPNAVGDGVAAEGEMTVVPTQEVSDYENGFYQFNDGYDFAQFYSSIYYPSWLMEQYRLYDDTGAPIYCPGEYTMPNGDVYTHQTSFKRRKKRFRHFEENTGENGTTYDAGDVSSTMVAEGNPPSDTLPNGVTPVSGDSTHEHQLNVDVQEFLPSTTTTAPVQNGGSVSSDSEAAKLDKNHSPRVTKKPPPAVKHPKSSSNSLPTGSTAAVGQTNGTATAVRPVAAMSHKIRKKDLIESTLAFAEQNIDLTRSKALTNGMSSLESDLDCWTTIDRNGRKRKEQVAIVKEKQVPAHVDQRPVVEKAASPPASAPSPTVTVLTDDASTTGSLDLNNKKNLLSTKNKKKTKPNKRQQQRMSASGLHRQHKHEGFQLIEPEFPSPVGHRARGGCDSVDKDDQLDTEGSQEEQQSEQHPLEEIPNGELLEEEKKNESVVPPTVDPLEVIAEQIKEEEHNAMEQIKSVELNCDKDNETVPAEAPPMTQVDVIEEQQEAQDMVLLATPPQPPQSPTVSAIAVVEEPIIVKKTETDLQQKPQIEQPMCEEEQSSVQCSVPLVVVGQEEQALKEVSIFEQPASRSVAEPVPEDEKLDGTQSPADDDQTIDEIYSNKNVLTSAAKQLALGNRRSLQLLQEKDNDVGEAGHDHAGRLEEEDESRGKRGSVSGVGYTESIDSGLQSPVSPCGGVSSPEASAMASSIASDEATPGSPPSEEPPKPLTQTVATWLLRKLEVHDLEEVFVLPSDPHLLQRLERFQLLQRGDNRLRAGTFSSDSEDVDDLEDEDSDSDYMSDGQGRHDRAADGAFNTLAIPVNTEPGASPTENDASLANAKIQLPSEGTAPTKSPVLKSSDSRSINSQPGAPREAASSGSVGDSKRCVIM